MFAVSEELVAGCVEVIDGEATEEEVTALMATEGLVAGVMDVDPDPDRVTEETVIVLV